MERIEKEKLFEQIYPLIIRMAKDYCQKHKLIDFEDLRQEASTKVWDKLDLYNSKKGRLTTFVYYIIRDAFQNELAKSSPVTIGKTNARILGRLQNDGEVNNVSEKRKNALITMIYISFDSIVDGGDNKNTTLKDIIPDNTIHYGRRKELENLLNSILKQQEVDNLLQRFGFKDKKDNYNAYSANSALQKIKILDDSTKRLIFELLSE